MNWEEFCLARQHLAEERIGRPMREQDRADLAQDRQGQDLLRARGLVR